MTLEVERAKVGRRPFVVVEIDLDLCTRTYGVAPCMASVGGTGQQKCFNTRATCQDSANYAVTTRTYRFCSNVSDVPRSLAALPFVLGVQLTPSKLKIGAGLGERGSVTITLADGKHNDVGVDPYVTERTYDPLRQGSYFGRLIARNAYYLGRPMRVLTGYLIDGPAGAPVFDASNFETRTYFLEKITQPDADGRVTITAKDLLKFADDERAQAPNPGRGRLFAGITNVAGSAVLTPSGVGDAYYGASGYIRINGEVMAFTRAGDNLTLTARGQYTTTAAAHNADDLVQECLVFSGQRVNQMLYTLLSSYTEVPLAYIDAAAWAAEDATYNTRLYSGIVAEPTGVNQLIGELLEQAPAYVWWDDVGAQIRYRTLRPASSASVTLDDRSNFYADSFRAEDKLDLRTSECWVYFGQRDPTEPLDKRSNYSATYVEIGDGEATQKYGQRRVKEIFARFIPSTARTFASEVAQSVVQRYNEVPKQVDFVLLPKDELELGDLRTVESRLVQNPDGSTGSIVVQIISRTPSFGNDLVGFTGLQERYVPSATSGQRIVTYSAPAYFNRNLFDDAAELYGVPTAAVDVVVIIDDGVVIGSHDPALPAFDVDDRWPSGSTITIDNNGRIQGIGARGGRGAGEAGFPAVNVAAETGYRGGDAFKTRVPVTLDNTGGEIWSGGGGGGGGGQSFAGTDVYAGAGGGGGQGTDGGPGGLAGPLTSGMTAAQPGGDGTAETYGIGGNQNHISGTQSDGGNGGGAGLDGSPGINGSLTNGAAGGLAGNAIDGVSHVTFTAVGDVRGAQVN